MKVHQKLGKFNDRNDDFFLNSMQCVFDDVYVDGNLFNNLKGIQTVILPASGGAVVEFTVTKEGNYPIVTHQFNDATKGAVGILKVTKDGKDDGKMASSH